jgi:hypothetical protein
MRVGVGAWILSWCLAVHAAELIRIPLAQRDVSSSELRRRDLGYMPLISDVVVGSPNVDLAYLGEVSIGTPPQSFLLSIPLFLKRMFELTGSY